jgi:hypothetical protein
MRVPRTVKKIGRMKKPISPTMHGVMDYATVAVTAAVPRLMKFPTRATRAADALAGGYGALAGMTDYPLGARRIVPFKGHGLAEAAVGLALPMLPWALGFAKDRAARNFFLGLTAVTFVVAALTDWSE